MAKASIIRTAKGIIPPTPFINVSVSSFVLMIPCALYATAATTSPDITDQSTAIEPEPFIIWPFPEMKRATGIMDIITPTGMSIFNGLCGIPCFSFIITTSSEIKGSAPSRSSLP